MNIWVKFFIGTPKRFLSTLIGISLVVVMIHPQILYDAVNHFLAAISPLLGPALTILIVLTGIKIILKGGK